MSSVEDLCTLLAERAAALGVEVVEEPLSRTMYGCYDRQLRRISLRPDLSPERRLRVLAHELAHSLLHRDPPPPVTYPRALPPGPEVEADLTSVLVSALVGLEPEAAVVRRALSAAMTIMGPPPDAP